jgi:hypothetical protein
MSPAQQRDFVRKIRYPSQKLNQPEYIIEAKSQFGQWYNAEYEEQFSIAMHVAEAHARDSGERTRIRNRWTGMIYNVPRNAWRRFIALNKELKRQLIKVKEIDGIDMLMRDGLSFDHATSHRQLIRRLVSEAWFCRLFKSQRKA